MPMLQRAKERVSAQTAGQVTLLHDDMRNLDLPANHFDIILASATLHHLRDDADWETVFTKFYKTLKTGGSIWISDLITHDSPPLNKLFNQQYSDYLDSLLSLIHIWFEPDCGLLNKPSCATHWFFPSACHPFTFMPLNSLMGVPQTGVLLRAISGARTPVKL